MSLQDYYNEFRFLATSGQLCEGADCRGWLLSDVDTFHKCPCGKATDANHPEAHDHDDCPAIGWSSEDDEDAFAGEVTAAPAVKAAPLNFVVTLKELNGPDYIPF